MHYKKAPPYSAILFTKQVVVACKNIWAGGWAFPTPNKAVTHIFTLVDCIAADKYVLLGGRQARHQVMPR
jgi:hypothetical protein